MKTGTILINVVSVESISEAIKDESVVNYVMNPFSKNTNPIK
jgi:hypothetical protein